MIIEWVAVGLNLFSLAINSFGYAKYRACLKELSNGHRQSSAGDRSQAGTGVDPQLTAISAAFSGSTGAIAPAGETGASPRVVVPQEILASRGWGLALDDDGTPVLWSLTRPVRWNGPTLTADRTPSLDSSSGIYAQRELEEGYSRLSVVGVVALSGVVVEGESGYRAEKATILSMRLRGLPTVSPSYGIGTGAFSWTQGGYPLSWHKRAWDIADQLAARYQCECSVDWLPTSELPAEELVT